MERMKRAPASTASGLLFGDVLRQVRRAAGLTQEELAELARLSSRGLSDLERGVNRFPRRETVLALADLAWRLNDYHTRSSTPAGILVLSLVVAALVSLGATYGGTLVFDYGFNVETAGDHPVWHESEHDVFPGQHD